MPAVSNLSIDYCIWQSFALKNAHIFTKQSLKFSIGEKKLYKNIVCQDHSMDESLFFMKKLLKPLY